MYGLYTERAAFQRMPLYEDGQCLEGEKEEELAALWLKRCDQTGERSVTTPRNRKPLRINARQLTGTSLLRRIKRSERTK